jgi:hypothetical protein
MHAPLVVNSSHERSGALTCQVIDAKMMGAWSASETTKDPAFTTHWDDEDGV